MKNQDFPGTPRLRLRALAPEDADFLYQTENDTTAWPDSDTVAPYSRELLRGYALTYGADPYAEGQLRLVAEDAATHEPIGVADLYDISARHRRAWVALYIVRGRRRSGAGAEALRLLEKYAAQTLLLDNLGAKVAETNTASMRLFESAGYDKAGVMKGWLKTAGGEEDMTIFRKKIR